MLLQKVGFHKWDSQFGTERVKAVPYLVKLWGLRYPCSLSLFAYNTVFYFYFYFMNNNLLGVY
jgi:hypothetical protein